MLLLHAFKAIYDMDQRYKLFIAGQFQDPRYVLYFQQMINEWGLGKNVFFDGWQDDVNKWLEDKHYILSTSVLESQHLSVMEAMAKGIKPLIHNFVGAETIYKREYIWSSIDDLLRMLDQGNYDSSNYRRFIKENYSLEEQTNKVKTVVNQLLQKTKKNIGTS